MEQQVLFLLLAFIAEILGTVGGFGSSLFFIPIASYFIDFQSALGITALFHLSSNVSKLTLFRTGIDKKLIYQIGVPSVVFVFLGAYMSKLVATELLKNILSVFLIGLSVLLLLYENINWKMNLKNNLIGGSVSGFLAGIIGTGGAIRGLLLTSFKLPIHTFIATSALIDLLVDSSRTIVYGLNGFIHVHDLFLLPWLFLTSFIGTWVGKLILNKVDYKKFRTLVLLLILMTGLLELTMAFS